MNEQEEIYALGGVMSLIMAIHSQKTGTYEDSNEVLEKHEKLLEWKLKNWKRSKPPWNETEDLILDLAVSVLRNPKWQDVIRNK